MYFAKGAADEEIAYPAVGAVFCDNVLVFAPLLISLKKHENPNMASGPFQNLIHLFGLWSTRAKRDSLEAAAVVHESEASKTRREAEELKVERINPIGIDKNER